MLKIYNTLTKTKEEFKPLKPPAVKMYACGVTVYDDCHIGHARSLYVFEVIRRYLQYRGYTVTFVRNITDIDDKIIDKARSWSKEQGISLLEAFDKVHETYVKSYYEDLERLGIPKADWEPQATENISEMIEYIKVLIKKEFAYTKEDGVYFSPRKFSYQKPKEGYGKLSGNSFEQMLSEVSGFSKEEALDFALWKTAKPNEPAWDSPWGKGRPGWHIECSVMSQKYLNVDTLDIHGGGMDLIFPHHENERAQSEAYTGKPFANYWIHHGLLTIDKQKMSKSLGNFITIKNFIERYKDADLLKLFFLSAHYSQPIDFTEERIEEAKKQKKKFNDFFDQVSSWKLRENKSKTPSSPSDINTIDAICAKFQEAMDDDFNMPRALACLFELVDEGLKFISADKEEAFKKVKLTLKNFFDILDFKMPVAIQISKEVDNKRQERDRARESKDFKKADEVRKELKRWGYITNDTGSGSTLIFSKEDIDKDKEKQI